MTDGSALLMSLFLLLIIQIFGQQAEVQIYDGGARFYSTYECSDGKYIAVGCIEEKFYKIFLEKLEIKDKEFSAQFNKDQLKLKRNLKKYLFLIQRSLGGFI